MDFNNQPCLPELPQSSLELPIGVTSVDSHSSWSFTETSCSLIHEEEEVEASIFNQVVRPEKSDQSDRPFRPEKSLLRTLSVAELSTKKIAITIPSRTMSAGEMSSTWR